MEAVIPRFGLSSTLQKLRGVLNVFYFKGNDEDFSNGTIKCVPTVYGSL